MVLLGLMLVAVTVTMCGRTRPFSPHPSLAPLRHLVLGLVAVGAVLLVASLFTVWWTIEDWEREETLVTRGASGFPLVVVGLGLISAALVVAGVQGRRNWSPAVLWFVWALVALGWFSSSGELTDSDASGSSGTGLELVTWGMLVVTVALVIGSFSRVANLARTSAGGTPPQLMEDRSR